MTDLKHQTSLLTKITTAVLAVAVPVCGLLFWSIIQDSKEDREYLRQLNKEAQQEIFMTRQELNDLRVEVARDYVTHVILDKRFDKIDDDLARIFVKLDQIAPIRTARTEAAR